jgi:hypothetical protein
MMLPNGSGTTLKPTARSESASPGLAPIMLADIEQKSPPRRILEASGRTVYAAEHLVFARGSTIYVQPFDSRRFQVTGTVIPVAEQAHYYVLSGATTFSVSDDLLIYRGGGPRVADYMWVDRKGKPVTTDRSETIGAFHQGHALSRDGQRLILERVDQLTGTPQLWLRDIRRGSTSRLTHDATGASHPVWSQDGTRFAYTRLIVGSYEIVTRPVDGGEAETVLRSKTGVFPIDWSPDTHSILYEAPEETNSSVSG